MLRDYYQLTKPGLVYGNVLSVIAGFLFASKWHFALSAFLAVVVGMTLVIASACVFNNYFDRDIDRVMTRTKGRPLVAGSISPRAALVYGAVLGIAGMSLLYLFNNMLTVLTAGIGWFVYVALYTPLKHRSSSALFVGAVAGAMPILSGYAAAVGHIDTPALVLFALLFLWQLPHFMAIAVYRFDEYRAAGVPLFVKQSPTPRARRIARAVFLSSLVVLVAGYAVIAVLPLIA